MQWANLMETPIHPKGTNQGYFRYYKTDGTYDELVAISGRLYKSGVALGPSFQSTRQIEAAQMHGVLYLATGTNLLQYDGTECKVVPPYLPTTMEVTFIGTNALSDNPTGHLQDTTGLVASIDHVIPYYNDTNYRRAIVVQVYITQITGEEYEFSVQYKKKSDTSEWKEPTTWTTRNASKVVLGKRVADPGEYLVLVSMRNKTTLEVLAQFPEFTYKVVNENPNIKGTPSEIRKCNRILIHWNRLVLYGNPDNPATMYFSHLNTPNYFPSLLNLEMDSPRREGITVALPYRNSLVIFTKSSTQALYGTSPEDYRRVMLHTDIGCSSPKGAAVMRNHIGFVSSQGIYSLKTLGLTDDKATVEKLDTKITNLVPNTEQAIAVYQNDQLQVTFPKEKIRLRFYADLGAWTLDQSDKFGFTGMQVIDGTLYARKGENVYLFDSETYTDDHEVYTNSFESKAFGLSQPYHQKKLKEFHILVAPKGQTMKSTVQVFADENPVTGVDNQYATVDENNEVVWKVEFEPNLDIPSNTTFGDWELGRSTFGETNYAKKDFRLTGKAIRTKVKFSNTEPKENHVIGFAYVFKTKKP